MQVWGSLAAFVETAHLARGFQLVFYPTGFQIMVPAGQMQIYLEIYQNKSKTHIFTYVHFQSISTHKALNKNHAQEPIDLRWCGPIYDCRLPRENPHNHLADLRASRLNRFDGPMARCAGAPVWNRDAKRWYASLETWWEVTREWRKTEMWRVIILSVTEKVTEISASKCLICWSRSFRQVGFLASFWRSWFFYLSQWPSEPPSGHTSLRPAQVEPATLAANGNLPRGTTSFCKLASGKLT